ncbi:HAUS augmin-like complex subunit 5 [Lepidochelys kempii]|uniref:HAUS augmin-like complex subunit 5 n=1 Tax=Lepidochelys kempii TaxID=8472 RepID=UPI003C6EF2F4
MADEVSLEAAQERIRDAQRHSLLLKAYAARLAEERQQLQGSVAQLRGRLEQLKDISRKAKVELTVGGKLPALGFAGLEPEVLRDVRTACQLRFHFLKSLFEHSTSGAVPSRTSEELLDASYQHWLSTVEAIVGSHPPNHVLAALEHLALENTLQMQELTSRVDIPRDVEALKWVPLASSGKLPHPPPLPPACWVPAPSPLPPCRPSAEGPGKGGGATARSLLRRGGGEELGMGPWGRGVESGQGARSTPTTLAPAPSPLL